MRERWEGILGQYQLKNINLPTAERHMKNAAIAGLISTVITLLYVVFGVLDSWFWADVILLAVLTIGVYRKHYLSGILLFVYFLLSKVLQFTGGIEQVDFSFMSLVLGLLFLHFYFLGALGAIKYRRLNVMEPKKRGGLLVGIGLGVLVTVGVGAMYSLSLPEEVEQDAEGLILEADYNEGYKAGYADGRAAGAEYGGSYLGIATEERGVAYDFGYLEGFVKGCREGGFECTDVEEVLEGWISEYETEQGVEGDVRLLEI